MKRRVRLYDEGCGSSFPVHALVEMKGNDSGFRSAVFLSPFFLLISIIDE